MENNPNSISEEASAFGQRAKGAVKDAYGSVTGNERIEREGEQENAQGNQRQANNQVFGSSTDTTGTSNRMVTGLFRDRDSAERAYSSVSSRGYDKDDVNVLMTDETRNRHFAGDDVASTELGSKALEGAGVGSAIGGTVGAVVAAIAAIGTSVLLPGIGLIVAGPLAAALAGAGAGGLTGGLIGALVGSGIPEEEAKAYEQGLKDGGIVMGVTPRNAEDAAYFENEFKSHSNANRASY